MPNSKLWFNSADKCSGNFCNQQDLSRNFDVELEVKVLSCNPTDETELELQFADGAVVWAQEIDTY